MLKKEYSLAGYLAASMIFGTLSFAQTPKDPRVLPGYNKSLQKAAVTMQKRLSAPSLRSLSSHTAQSKQSYAKGEVIVVMKQGLSAVAASSLLAEKGVNVVKEFKTLSSKSKSSYMLVSGNVSTQVLISKLKSNPNVKSVSPNYKRMMDAVPNDPMFGDVWGLHNTGQTVNEVSGTSNADIDGPEAWDTESNASDTVVAVFDTGVEYNHEDLAANMWVNSAEASGTAGVDDDGNGYVDDIHGYDFAAQSNGDNDADPMDIHGHGTHVSGTIGAKGDNGVGIAGVNWGVNIMALKIFRPDMGAYDSDILEAIDYVLTMKENGVNIVSINASYGGTGGSQDDPMNDAIKSLGSAGIVFSSAAGNSGEDNDATPHYPSSYDASNIIAVAATDQDDNLAGFSCYGHTSVDLAAPGTNILSSLPGGGEVDGSIFSDDIESGDANWATSGTNNSWAVTTEDAYSLTHAWTDSPGASYVDDTNASLTYTSDIDLLAFAGQAIGVGACMKYELESGYDKLHIEVSGDSGASWTTLESITGTQDWGCSGVVISEALKTANFRMRFRLETDGSVTYNGVHIDNVAIGAISASDNYDYWDGTSMATPHVTGSIALMATQYPSEDIDKRINRILSGAAALNTLTGKVVTGGLLNIANSIDPALVFKPTIAEVNQTEGLLPGTPISINGTEFGASQGKVYFTNGKGAEVEGSITSWSDTGIAVTVPEGAGKFISMEKSTGERSLNTVKGSAWEQAAKTNNARAGAAAVAYSDKVYVFGGYDSVTGESMDSAEAYDPGSDSWTDIAAMPTLRDLLSAAELNGKIYVIGGYDESNGEIKDVVEVYDPNNDSWETVAPLPIASYQGAAVAVNGSLYYVAGIDGSNYLDKLYMYNEGNNTWSEKASLGTPRGLHSAVAYEGEIYVFGGYNGSIPLTSAESYNPADDSWTTIADMPSPLISMGAASSSDSITIAGGINGNFLLSDQVMHYNPQEDTWKDENGSLRELITPKYAASLVFLENRGFLSIGGYTEQSLDEVELLKVNSVPTAENDTATVAEDSSVDVDVLSNDSDEDGDTLSISSVTTPANGTVTINGTQVTYTPNSNYNGSDSFSYAVGDGNGGTDTTTVSVTVTAVNDVPVAQNDTATVAEDNSIVISALSNDSDEDGDTLSISSVTTPANGTVTINGTQVTYTPNSNYNGSDSFSYAVGDGNGGTDTTTVSVTVTAVNDVPVAQNDTATVAEDNSIVISALSNDSDEDGDTLSISSVTTPANGTVTINGTQVTYTPNSNYNGSDSFSYAVGDGNGGTDTATVSVTITPVDDGDSGSGDSGSGGSGGGCTYNPDNTKFDFMFIFMMLLSLFYPLRHKYIK